MSPNPVLKKQAIIMLLGHNIDPLAKNKNNKTALDCLPLWDNNCKRVLKDAMRRKCQSGIFIFFSWGINKL